MRSRPVVLLGVAMLTSRPVPAGRRHRRARTSPPPRSPARRSRAASTIYGAASLTAVLAKVKTTYEAANPGVTLTISTGSSTALETQIEQGAPADVFLSADTANPQKLVSKGLAAGAPVNFAGNLLTVIVPTANPAGIATPADLAKPRRQDHRGRRHRADLEVRRAARGQPRQAAGLPGRLRRGLHSQRRVQGGQRLGRGRQDRTRRGGRRDRVRHRREDLDAGRRASRCLPPPTCRRPTRGSSSRVPRTWRRRRRSSPGSRALMVRPSSPRSASCRRPPERTARRRERHGRRGAAPGRPLPSGARRGWVDPPRPRRHCSGCSSPSRSPRSSCVPSSTVRSGRPSARRSCSMP